MTKFVLITGFIGSGKSAVSSYLREKSYKVIDMDSLIKDMYLNDLGTKDILLQTFGERAFNGYDKERGKILPDFNYLKNEMFKLQNKEKRLTLVRRILHERIKWLFFFENYDNIANTPVVFLEAALTESIADLMSELKIKDIINVNASDKTRRQRLKEHRGMSDEEIELRENIQKWPGIEPGTNTYTVNNDLDIENLKSTVNYILATTNLITDTEKRELFKIWIDHLSDTGLKKAYCSAFKADIDCKHCQFPCKEWLNKKDKND